MAAMVFSGCDLLTPVDDSGGNGTQNTVDNLVITGEDSLKKKVVITIKRPPAQRAPLTPQDGDTYDVNYDNAVVSSGTITVAASGNGKEITFIPTNGTQFKGTYTGGNNLSIQGGNIPGTPIQDFKPVENGNNGGSSTADAVVRALGGKNVEAKGGIVYINGDVTVPGSVDIPDTIKLVFNSRDNASFIINNTTTSDVNVSVTARGGIEVPQGRGVTTLKGTGTLIVEGDSAINGRFIVDGVTTLDIIGNATIEDGGRLELTGGKTVKRVATEKYSINNTPDGADAVFRMRGNMIVRNGGRFQMPDPYQFDTNDITGVIKVESGGELILVTADPNGKSDLHPWIGTDYTMTQGAPIGADFVMYPDNKQPESWIEVRFSGKDKAIPVLELTGNATALGRLILDEEYNKNNKPNDQRKPPYRFEVWLTYPFTVTAKSALTIGNSGERNLFSALLVTGDNSYNLPTPSPPATPPNPPSTAKIKGINKGVLTNNGSILVSKKNAIVEWFGGYFNHNDKVLNPKDKLTAIFIPNRKWDPYGSIDIKVWSPEWPPDWNQGDPPLWWWNDGLK